MDKNLKLRQYRRKDYSELVEFPVEIVGRDGTVRRYTFEDSIQLYQRRLTVASVRYDDQDLVEAERGHCRARIDQLRRSFFHAYGWGIPLGHTHPSSSMGDLAGEVAAFLCRVLQTSRRLELSLAELARDDSGPRVFFVSHPRLEEGMLMYVYLFEDESSGMEGPRNRFFRQLAALESNPMFGDAEQLVAFHHLLDCGFVITGRAGARLTLEVPFDEESPDPQLEASDWDRALLALRSGTLRRAYEKARRMTALDPWHRRAQITSALLAVRLGRFEEAEELVLVARGYFPDEPLLQLAIGLSRLHRHEYEAAQADLTAVLDAVGGDEDLRWLKNLARRCRGWLAPVWRSAVRGHEGKEQGAPTKPSGLSLSLVAVGFGLLGWLLPGVLWLEPPLRSGVTAGIGLVALGLGVVAYPVVQGQLAGLFLYHERALLGRMLKRVERPQPEPVDA